MPDYRLTRLRGKLAVTWTDEHGVRRRISTGESDPVAATRFMDRMIREAVRPLDVTIDSILDHHITALEGRAKHPIAQHQAKPLRRAMGRLLPMQVTKTVITDYATRRAAEGRKPSTIRSEVGLLSTALNRAVKDRMIAERPAITLPADGEPREHHLTRAEFERFLAACQAPHVRLFAILAIATGARASAILELTWDRVDFERGQIDLRVSRFTPMKGRAIVPMTASARAALSQAKQIALCNHVIEHGGEPVARVTKGIKAAAVRSGLPWVSPHVFRHSAAVWLAEDGHSMVAIAQYLGHEDSRTTERIYARFSPAYLRSLAASLEAGSFAPAATTQR